MHRDISSGNILLYLDKKKRWRGLLNDWEQSKPTDPGDLAGRQQDRTVSSYLIYIEIKGLFELLTAS